MGQGINSCGPKVTQSQRSGDQQAGKTGVIWAVEPAIGTGNMA
jgi:hypothetical protein